jgi:ubiquitin-conjugating enzyme E2 O
MGLTIDDDSFDDEESDRVSGSEDLDLLDDENGTIERGAGSVAVFGSLLDGQLESIRRMVEDTAAKDFIWRGKIFGKDQDDIKKSSGSIDADSISRLVKNALPPGLFEEDTADAAVDDIMERYKKLSFSAHTELKKTLTRYSDEELKLLLISTHFWRRRRGAGFEEDDEVLGDNAEPSDLEKDFVSKAQLNAEYAARSRRYKDMAHPRNIAKAYPGIFLDADDARTTVSDVLRDSSIRSNMVGLNAFHSLVEAKGPRNTSRDEMPSLLDSLNFVWRQERKEKVKQLENQFLCRSPRQTLSKVDDDATIADENNINDEDEEALSTSFDVVDGGFSDFLLRDSSSQMNLPRQVQKAVQKEWSILHKGLPANEIWVKSSQAKMNVLRAMIKGPSLTPYHDGLFCFDILFDENYPSVPPKVHYHSYGYRLNPNLYKEGKVCLSLLNTWDSEENSERWSSSSSALQVLVSLQALVLNDKPYYNEAGYEKQRGTEEGIRNSAMYSENAYLLNLKTMIQTIKRPPVGFEALVRAHFKSRRASILKSIAAYLEGAPVGSYCDDPNVQHTKHDTHNVKPTKGFLLSLQGLQETVRTAFRKI